MTKQQSCPHHPNADPAVVPTGKVLAYGVQPDGVPTEDIIKYPCPYCWQRHAECLQGALDYGRDEIVELREQLATAKADMERLAGLVVDHGIIEIHYEETDEAEGFALLAEGKYLHDGWYPTLRQAIDKAKEGK